MFTYPANPYSSPVSPNLQPQSTGSLHADVPDVWFLCVAQAKQLGTGVSLFLRPLHAHLQGLHLHGTPRAVSLSQVD